MEVMSGISQRAGGWAALSATTAWLFIALVSTQPALGQTRSLRFDHLDSDHGLSQNDVYAVLQDRLGFMWFGTQDGLNRYDG